MKSIRLSIFLPLTALILAGCTTSSTTESRIAHRPELFQALPESHRTAVHRGEVREGMSKDAVYLAWGRADEVVKSSRKGRATETWRYLGTRTVSRAGFGVGLGYGYGFSRYGSCYGYDPFFHSTHNYEYREYVAAQVEFENGKVVSWERNLRAR